MIIRQPEDGWGLIKPRPWQARCYPTLLKHYSVPNPSRALVRGVCGSGKSILAAQMAASCGLNENEVVVVSTSSIFLVEQLKKTFQARLEGDSFLGTQKVGAYYTKAKESFCPVVICCTNSVPELAITLKKYGKRVSLWICDEAHRSEVATIKNAFSDLNPERVFGLTATPFRSNKEESLSLFDKLLEDFGPKEAIAEGRCVVPWRIVSWEGGEADLDSACIEMTQLARGPGIFSASTIADAVVFSQKLRDNNIRAEAVHSKLLESDVTKRINDLRDGNLDAIVHVSMLQEGADFPWLRWICLRRCLTARTRFVQEVGRALRWYLDPVTGEEKKEAVIYDPHGLFTQFKLTYDEALGGSYEIDAPDEITEEDETKQLVKQLEQSVFDIMSELMKAKAGKTPLSTTALAAYLGEVVNAMDVAGLITRKIASRSWRSQSMSAKQMSTIQNMLWSLKRKCVPPKHQRALELLTQHGPSMNKGTASDLITIQMSLADKKKWPDFKTLNAAVDDGLKKHAAQLASKGESFAVRPVRPDPLSKPPVEPRTPQQIKKDFKEAEKKRPTLFD